MSEDRAYEVCNRCARIVNRKYKYIFDIDELISVGCCQYIQLSSDIQQSKMAYPKVYFEIMRYAYNSTLNKDRLVKNYQDVSKKYEVDCSMSIDIVDAWKSLDKDEQLLLHKYLIEGRTLKSLCKDYNKNNPMSIKIMIDKIKNKLRNKLKGY